jgi:hypothetical protein
MYVCLSVIEKSVSSSRCSLTPPFALFSVPARGQDVLRMENVDAIPRDIDGERHYIVSLPQANFPKYPTRHASVLDERPFGVGKSTTLTLNSAKFEGRVNVAHCRGGLQCLNKRCPYFISERTHNVTSFETVTLPSLGSGAGAGAASALPRTCQRCTFCSSVDLVRLPCSALKKIAVEAPSASSVRLIHVLHYGHHSLGCFHPNVLKRSMEVPASVRSSLERLGSQGAPAGAATHRTMEDLTASFFRGDISQEALLDAGVPRHSHIIYHIVHN